MVQSQALRYVLSAREYQYLHNLAQKKPLTNTSKEEQQTEVTIDQNAAAFRSASRVFIGSMITLKITESLLAKLRRRTSKSRSNLNVLIGGSKTSLALSISSLLFFHRILHRLFTQLRYQLLHEKVRNVRLRYPNIYAALTSRLAPAIGASLSGLTLGICPATQLRVTIVIFFAVRALELSYKSLEVNGYLKNKPWWFGSWLLFPVTQAQLLHAFVFDRDCFPEAYGKFILGFTPEYVKRRPDDVSTRVVWPTDNQILDSLAQIATLRWPAFISPILHPEMANTLPLGVNNVISPITSRANPAHTHLSCALIHPFELSCFMAYIRQHLIAFPQMARFFTLYYGALSLLKIRGFFKSPVQFLNKLGKQVLRTTLAIEGAIGTAWGSICLFAAILPRSVMPRSRFILGGLLGGLFQFFDRTPSGHANALYAARTSIDSFWKVGVKHGWWRGIKGGDVFVFVTALALYNVVYDQTRDTVMDKDRGMALVRILRGEVELGLADTEFEDKSKDGVETKGA